MWIGDKLGNDLFINDPNRANRLEKAARDGCDGSYHYEIIEDWEEYSDGLSVYVPDEDDPEGDFDLTLDQYNTIKRKIKECEDWHIKNGSYETQIG
jgi:hypothetical protein